MWTRAELKKCAKEKLKNYYWPAFLVTFLLACLCSWGINVKFSYNTSMEFEEIKMLLMESMVKAVIITTLIQIFAASVITVGVKRFFLCARLGDVAVPHMFDGFRGGKYFKMVFIMFLKNIQILLWTIVLIVPGIMKYYEYMMVPYILADNPNISGEEALRQSKIMMDGEKWNTFVLHLSFLGWMLLGLLACGMGAFFVLPYVEATTTELYQTLRNKVQQ